MPDLTSADSITLVIHGVGYTTERRLLRAAVKGYRRSGFAEAERRFEVEECPSLSRRKKSAAAISMENSGKLHVLLVLPWADGRLRLSDIARCSCLIVAALAAMAAGMFFVREPLDAVVDWLSSWSHIILVYGILLAAGVSVHIAHLFLTGSMTTSKFHAPPPLIVFVPGFLSVMMSYFLRATSLWILVALITCTLWIVPAVTALRCIGTTSLRRWRAALAGLIVALSLPAGLLIRSARTSNLEAARVARGAEILEHAARSPTLGFPFGRPSANPAPAPVRQGDGGSAEEYEQRMRQRPGNNNEKVVPDDGPRFGSQASVSRKTEPKASLPLPGAARPATLAGLAPSANSPRTPAVPGNLGDAEYDLLQQRHWIADYHPGWLETIIQKLSNVQIGAKRKRVRARLRDAADRVRFRGQVKVMGELFVLCLLAWIFSWTVDFPMDVLHYAGQEGKRTRLVQQTVAAIGWLHDQAPGARIILVGHSLGSAIASEAAVLVPPLQPPRRLTLVTLGSPLNYLSRIFPDSFHSAGELSKRICERFTWVNLWRSYDPIGKRLDIRESGAIQYCVGSGGHTNYWADGDVWRAIARSSLVSGPPIEDAEKPNTGHGDSCLFEQRLGIFVFAAIALLAFCSVALWVLNR